MDFSSANLKTLIITFIIVHVSSQEYGNIRLIGGTTLLEGRVEIFFGSWGTICDDDWDKKDADVVCKSLGFSGAQSATTGAWFGQGSGPVLLNHVNCKGTETDILDCAHDGFKIHDCSHSEDAGVVCQGIKLVDGGLFSSSGRVEVLYAGVWGTVCNDYWDMKDAEVVCKQLGYTRAENIYSPPQGIGPIWMDNVHCSGNEESVQDCAFNGWGENDCEHESDAGVICYSRAHALLKKLIAVLTLLGILFVVAMCCGCFYLYKRQRRRRQGPTSVNSPAGRNGSQQVQELPPYPVQPRPPYLPPKPTPSIHVSSPGTDYNAPGPVVHRGTNENHMNHVGAHPQFNQVQPPPHPQEGDPLLNSEQAYPPPHNPYYYPYNSGASSGSSPSGPGVPESVDNHEEEKKKKADGAAFLMMSHMMMTR